MRPLFLSIDGLTCFKDKQEVDFSALDLFAISGPTGAGKSSLLDGMVFALYGEIPRLRSRHGVKELISASRDRASVRFDFQIGQQRYRITRAIKRRGSASVQLDRHDGEDFNQNIAVNVKATKEALQPILGMSSEAFTQAVILPQGEFHRFLRAEPSDRRDMLRTLLRLDIFERMRREANAIAGKTKATLAASERLLVDEYEGVDEQALTALEGELQAANDELAEQGKLRAASEDRLKGLRAARAKCAELEQCTERAAELHEKAAEIAVIREQLDAAVRSDALTTVIDEARRAERAAADARDEANEADEAREEAVAEHRRAATVCAEAEQRAAQVPTMRGRLEKLDQVIGRLHERDGLRSRIDKLRDDLAAKRQKGEEVREALDQLAGTLEKQRTAIEEAEKAIAAADYDKDLDRAVDGVRDLASRLFGTRKQLAGAEAALETQTTALATSREQLAHATEAAEETARGEAAATEKLRQAEEALHRAHRLDAADHLRGSLAAGEPCPVCEQVVESPPAAELEPEVERAKEAVASARAAVEQARREATQAQQIATKAEAELGSAQKLQQQAERELHELRASVAALEQEIREALGSHAPAIDEPIETWVERRVAALAEAREAFNAAREALQRVQQQREKSVDRQQRDRERLGELEAACKSLAQDLAETEGRLRTLEQEIAQVTEADDPAGERQTLSEQIEELERTLKTAAEQRSAAQTALELAESTLRHKREIAEKAKSDALSRRQRCNEAIASAGFESVEAVEQARLEESRQQALNERIESHARELHATEARRDALLGELGEQRVSSDELETAEEQAATLRERCEALLARRGELEQRTAQMKQRLEKAEQLRERIESDRNTEQIYSHLASDLRSDNFQEYLLAEAFTEMVAGASTRLQTLSGERYALAFEDKEIVVVDHDNAGETRSSKTLSGGETFLASLALALELSAQVQRAAGAVHLDSLFIDEGFGTLDPDTLSVVAETIQSLQVGGRMVGIITHIPELRDEFAQQIVVTKHQGYSTVKAVVDGVGA